jgi:heme-degrading monooxygenase HmoA
VIARIWQGQTRPGMGESYLEYLERTGLTQYRATPGFRGVFVLRRESDAGAEYVLISLWDDMDAVRGFAGPEPERAVYYPEDDRYFPEAERRPYLKHYDVLVAGDPVSRDRPA